MASAAGNQSIGTSSTKVFDAANDGGRCSEFMVGVRTGSSNAALVHVPGLHKSGEFIGIPAGAAITFRLSDLGIANVYVKGDGGTTTVDYGVVSKMMHP